MNVSTKMPIHLQKRAWALNMGAFQAPALFLAVTALYAVTINTTPVRVDEYYTLFAARSWAADHGFAIVDGEYTRARLFTMLVGAAFGLFEDTSLLTARIPTVLTTAGLVTLLFVWVRGRAGVTAATIAALVLALSGYTLDVAHFARFYAPQALAVLGAAILVHAAAEKEGVALATRLAGAAALLALGFHLQPTTAIAGGALAAWFAVQRLSWIRSALLRSPWLALAVGVSIVYFFFVILPPMVARFQGASIWAQAHQYDHWFYLREFYNQIPLILVLLPVAAVAALFRDRSLALLAIVMVAIALVMQSFAAMKAGRYFYYAMPFVALLFGLALARPMDMAIAAGKRALTGGGVPQELAGLCASVAIAIAGVGLLLVNSSYRHTAIALRQSVMELRDPLHVAQPADPVWDEAAPALRRMVLPDDFLVASDDLRTIAHIRPQDMLINGSHLSDLRATADFTRDVRTGRPILASVAGLDRMIDCRTSGIVVVDDAHWRVAKGVPVAVADRIEQRMSPVRPGVAHFRLFRWHHRPTASCPWMTAQGRAA